MRALEQLLRPETVDELPPWENGDAVEFARTRLVRDKDAMAECSLFGNCTKSFEVILRCVSCCLRLDSDLPVYDEIHFKVGARTPVGNLGVPAKRIDISRKFVHDPALKGVSIFGRSSDERFSSLKPTRHTHVEEIELSRLMDW